MKATGIVRRIDDLGRVVIPKEIRRTMHIREGDPLEIFTDKEGEVIFKKYSPVGEMSSFSTQYAEVLARCGHMTVLVCDRDHIITAAGSSRRDFLDKPVSAQLDSLMADRQTYVSRPGTPHRLQPTEQVNRYASVAAPILAAGDVTGAVCMVQPESGTQPTDCEVQLIQVAAAFLGRQMEE